ncbi:Tat pathway signal sequence domain protein [Actinoplanes sp. NEAU-A12]|uniref:Tat pathway signal sequence domain protein n=1 Tax=Actinoplanes sandaracinus TaxID=3045177 RepID=A0ABT6WIL8_9ACTN|nr:Tat pathway signal sequence domain protein [Actinoplanes sandaracinus]MDI6099558.1 Tat pathway signal sequence domain protein [Actinoplanes sandaracinus]
MHSNRIAAAALTGAAVALLFAAPALADDDTVLTSGSPAGAAVAVGDTISAGLATGSQAVFATAPAGTSGMKCDTSSFSAVVNDNPAAPGAAVLGSTLGLADCTVTGITGVLGVNRVTVNNQPYATTVASDGTVTVTGTDSAPISATLVLRTLLGSVTCVFVADGNTISGTADNTDNSIAFADQKFNKSTGPSACVTNGYFTAKYTPVADAAAAPVFVN